MRNDLFLGGVRKLGWIMWPALKILYLYKGIVLVGLAPLKLRLRNLLFAEIQVQAGFNRNVAEPEKKRFNAYKADPYQLKVWLKLHL